MDKTLAALLHTEFDHRLSGYRAFFESCPMLRAWIMEEFDKTMAIATAAQSGNQ